jgi:hypothetical protein
LADRCDGFSLELILPVHSPDPMPNCLKNAATPTRRVLAVLGGILKVMLFDSGIHQLNKFGLNFVKNTRLSSFQFMKCFEKTKYSNIGQAKINDGDGVELTLTTPMMKCLNDPG